MSQRLEHDVSVGATRHDEPAVNVVASIAQALAAASAQDPREDASAAAHLSAEWRRALRAGAARARNGGIRCEQFVIIVKSVWYSRPAISRSTDHATQRERLNKLVTQAIASYYEQARQPDD